MIGTRIKEICGYLGINESNQQTEFAEKIGFKQQNISNYINGKNSPKMNFYEAVAKAIPEVNIEWLKTGKGEMIGGIFKEIGERLKLLRKEKGFSQSEFSQQFGVDQSTISNFENGKVVSAEVILNLAKIYPNFSLDWLIKGKGNMWFNEGQSITNIEELDNKMIVFLKDEIHFLRNTINHLIDTKDTTTNI